MDFNQLKPNNIIALFGMMALFESCLPKKADTSESIALESPPLIGTTLPQNTDLGPQLSGNYSFCPQKKYLNTSNLVGLSFLSGLEYQHFSTSSKTLVSLGFGRPKDALFYQKLSNQIEIAKLESKIPTQFKSWSTETERQTLLNDSRAQYQKTFGEPIFTRDILSLYKSYIDIEDPNREIYYIVGTKQDPSKKIDQASTQAFYAEHNGQDFAVISFRGTETNSRVDIDADLDVAATPMPEFESEKVMRGFYNAYKEVDRKLADLLKQRSQNRKKPLNLWITGHSLGGAAATLLTADLLSQKHRKRLKNINLMGLYTYGSPRVGDNKFALRFDALAMFHNVPIYRVRHSQDIVTAIPFGLNANPGFWHVGSLVYIDRKNQVYFGNGWQDIEKNSDLLRATPTSLNDHSIDLYAIKLLNFKKTTQDPMVSACSAIPGERGLAPYVENPDLRKIDWKKATKALEE